MPALQLRSSKEARPIPLHRLICGAVLGSAGIVAMAVAAGAAPADAPWHEGFEGPNSSWRAVGADLEYRLEIHGRARGGAHTGQGSEQLRINAANGSYVYFAHAVPSSRITADLAPSVWIKADRPGLQILGRIVLPNLIDPHTRKPATVYIRGTSYSQVGIWEQMRIDNVPRELQHQLWVLNQQYAHEVDSRGAYLDQIVLNVYGGAGTTNVAIDDLEVGGIVGLDQAPIEPRTTDRRPESKTGPFSREPLGERGLASSQAPARDVKLDGSVLLVDGHPFFPRILRYQGEPLELIAKTGFNAIRLSEPPPPQLLADAQRLGLWIICPPPHGVAARPDLPPPLIGDIGPAYDNVLAWHLGEGLTAQELPAVSEIARQLQLTDTRRRRPTICAGNRFARLQPSGRSALVRPRTVGDEHRVVGLYGLAPRAAAAGPARHDVLDHGAMRVVSRGRRASGGLFAAATADPGRRRIDPAAHLFGSIGRARGIEFRLETSLDHAPPSLRTDLALLNLELELAEPWAATGSYVTTANSIDLQVVGAVLQTETTHLLLPMRIAHRLAIRAQAGCARAGDDRGARHSRGARDL